VVERNTGKLQETTDKLQGKADKLSQDLESVAQQLEETSFKVEREFYAKIVLSLGPRAAQCHSAKVLDVRQGDC